MVNYMNYPK